MAAPGPSPDDLKALDLTRQRLQQLVNSMTSLRRDIDLSDPLPPWPSLLATTSLIAHNLASLSAHLATQAPLFASAHPYPLPAVFPGRAQEGVLQQLLRQKVEPEVGEWLEAGETIGKTVDREGSAEEQRTRRTAREEFWEWAAPRAGEIARKILVEGGGRAEGEEYDDDDVEEEEDDDDDDDEEEGLEEGAEGGEKMDVDDGTAKTTDTQRASRVAIPMLPLEDICRFMSTGAMPLHPQKG